MRQTFKQFLVENNGRTSIIERNEAFNFIKKNCSQYIRGHSFIYRGARHMENDYYYGNAQGNPRRSANTYNYYTYLMDEILPSWHKYPPRSESFICSTALDKASRYGRHDNAYMVFPPDNTPIGICPVDDIWFSFMKGLKMPLIDFTEKLAFLFKTVGFAVPESDNSLAKFKQAIKQLEDFGKDKLKEKIDNPGIENFVDKVFQNDDIISTLNDLMDPDDNGFRLQEAKNFTANHDKEVWFSGPAVFVHHENIRDVFDNIRQ